MSTIKYEYKILPADETKWGKGFSFNSISKKEFDSFDHSILGLGNLNKDGEYIQSLAVFFDLEGFTSFSNQVDSHLVIPEYLSRYFEWLFSTIKILFKESETKDRIKIFGSLPFFAKFLGDGILFLWDTSYAAGFSGICNIVLNLVQIQRVYTSEFYPEIIKHVSNPPPRLRCGVARGQIISLGEGSDYVGPCINIASRLQKVSNLSFALSRRGFDLSKNPTHDLTKILSLKKTLIRGVESQELIYILQKEYDMLDTQQKMLFTD